MQQTTEFSETRLSAKQKQRFFQLTQNGSHRQAHWCTKFKFEVLFGVYSSRLTVEADNREGPVPHVGQRKHWKIQCNSVRFVGLVRGLAGCHLLTSRQGTAHNPIHHDRGGCLLFVIQAGCIRRLAVATYAVA